MDKDRVNIDEMSFKATRQRSI